MTCLCKNSAQTHSLRIMHEALSASKDIDEIYENGVIMPGFDIVLLVQRCAQIFLLF